MALKDTWRDLVNSTNGIDGDDASVDNINEIAHAVIDLEKNGNASKIEIDNEMSDVSENAVQNKVIKSYIDDAIGDVEAALDEIISIQNKLIGGDIV